MFFFIDLVQQLGNTSVSTCAMAASPFTLSIIHADGDLTVVDAKAGDGAKLTISYDPDGVTTVFFAVKNNTDRTIMVHVTAYMNDRHVATEDMPIASNGLSTKNSISLKMYDSLIFTTQDGFIVRLAIRHPRSVEQAEYEWHALVRDIQLALQKKVGTGDMIHKLQELETEIRALWGRKLTTVDNELEKVHTQMDVLFGQRKQMEETMQTTNASLAMKNQASFDEDARNMMVRREVRDEKEGAKLAEEEKRERTKLAKREAAAAEYKAKADIRKANAKAAERKAKAERDAEEAREAKAKAEKKRKVKREKKREAKSDSDDDSDQ